MDEGVRARIDSLVWLARRWPRGAARVPLDEWARQFDLDPLLVRRIVQGEGLSPDDDDETDEVDPNQTTSVMRRADLDLGSDVPGGNHGGDDADPDAGETISDGRRD